MSVSIGEVAPDFALTDTEGRRWSVAHYDGAPATVVLFTADYDNPRERAEWLRDALDAVLAGSILSRPETKPVGCSIKWKS